MHNFWRTNYLVMYFCMLCQYSCNACLTFFCISFSHIIPATWISDLFFWIDCFCILCILYPFFINSSRNLFKAFLDQLFLYTPLPCRLHHIPALVLSSDTVFLSAFEAASTSDMPIVSFSLLIDPEIFSKHCQFLKLSYHLQILQDSKWVHPELWHCKFQLTLKGNPTLPQRLHQVRLIFRSVTSFTMLSMFHNR